MFVKIFLFSGSKTISSKFFGLYNSTYGTPLLVIVCYYQLLFIIV
jgi:hypothetical protein